jgi:hypothetical protein
LLLADHLLLRIHRRQPLGIAVIGRLLLIHRLRCITLRRWRIAEQEFDEAAAHVGALRLHIGGAHRRLRRAPVGVDHGGLGRSRRVDRHGMMGNGNKRRGAGKQRKRGFPEHRRTLYWFRRDVMREGA